MGLLAVVPGDVQTLSDMDVDHFLLVCLDDLALNPLHSVDQVGGTGIEELCQPGQGLEVHETADIDSNVIPLQDMQTWLAPSEVTLVFDVIYDE